MDKERFEQVKKWIVSKQRQWTLVIEDDKIRVCTGLFIMDMRIIRAIEQELKFEVMDIMYNEKFGIVLLCKDTVKSTGI